MPSHTPDQKSPAHTIESQRADWNRVAPGWEQWDRLLDENMTCLNHRLVADARLRAGQRVLDLGSGTGYPALLAAQVVGKAGGVIGMDLAENMLAIAKRKADALGLANLEFRAGDITELPFEGACFDAVTSRFCLMFLPDIPKAAREIARVLKAGGYVTAAVWSTPDKNPYLRIPLDVVKQFVDLPPPDPAAPGIFRLAAAGDLAKVTREAGLRFVGEEEYLSEMRFPSAEQYYRSLIDLAAPLQNLFAKLSADQQKAAKEQIIEAATAHTRDGSLALPIAVRFVTARKPL